MSFVPRFLCQRISESSFWKKSIIEYIAVLGGNHLRCMMVRTYVAHIMRIFADTLKLAETVSAFLSLTRTELVGAILRTNPTQMHQRRMARIAVNHFLGEVIFRDHPVLAARLFLRTKHVFGRTSENCTHPALDVAIIQRKQGRDHFTPSEMGNILNQAGLSLRDRLMLTIMAETGLRRRAIAWLTVSNVYDTIDRTPLCVCRALEKGLNVRSFMLSDRTKELLSRYINEGHHRNSQWLFPSPRDVQKHISPLSVNCILVRACANIGIRGTHVHSHAIRKFVVCELMAAQNRIENVAKFVGHRAVNMTYGTYWDIETSELTRMMHIPWLKNEHSNTEKVHENEGCIYTEGEEEKMRTGSGGS